MDDTTKKRDREGWGEMERDQRTGDLVKSEARAGSLCVQLGSAIRDTNFRYRRAIDRRIKIGLGLGVA
jgi:hypothetical protein